VQLVDNASANDEAAIIAKEFPEVNVLAQSENLGFCGGCNVAVKRALEEGADFIMLLNNDTILTQGLIEDLINEYKKLNNPGAVSPVILHYPETDKVWFSIAKWEANWKSGETGFRLALDQDYEALKDREPYPTEFACGCCLFVSARVVEDVGLFDERYFAFYDEAEWCARMKRRGYDSYIIPSATMYHKVGGSTPNLVMTYLLTRNRLLWISENLPLKKKLQSYPVLIKELSWHVLNRANMIPGKCRYDSRERSRVYIQGWKDYFLRRFGKWGGKTEKIIFDL
jgi:GT2 family glycosyltransferase